MGTYYHLYNDTRKEQIHWDNHIKSGPIKFNQVVHYKLINYMFEHRGDVFRLLSDDGSEPSDYTDVDLKEYVFGDEKVNKNFREMADKFYERILLFLAGERKR